MAWSPILLCLAPGQLLVFIELLVDFFLGKKSLQRTRPISLIVELFCLCFSPSVYFCWEGGVQNGFSSYCLLISKYYLNLNTPIYFPASFTPHFTFNPCYFFVVVVVLRRCHIVLNLSCKGLWLFWKEAATVDEFSLSSQFLTMTDVTSSRIVTAAQPTPMAASGAMTIVSPRTTAAQKARSVSQGFQRTEKSRVGLGIDFSVYGINTSPELFLKSSVLIWILLLSQVSFSKRCSKCPNSKGSTSQEDWCLYFRLLFWVCPSP